MASRTSTYPLPPTTSFEHLSHLEDCIRATESCSSALSSGLTRLQPGVADLPRLTKILSNKHHYLVLPHPTILAHKSALSTSLAPQIDQLITKAESSVEAEQGRVKRLEERLSILQSARLPLLPETSFREHDTEEEIGGVGVEEEDEGSKLVGLEMKELNPAQRRKVVMLKAKRERLEKERARLAG